MQQGQVGHRLGAHDVGAAATAAAGEVLHVGDPREIAREYNELNFGRLAHEPVESGRYGDQAEAEILDTWCESAGETVTQLAQTNPLDVCVRVKFYADMADPIVGVTLRNEAGHTVFNSTTEWAGVESTGSFHAGDEVTIRFSIENWLSPSQYTLSPSVARPGSGANAIDLREDLTSIYVHATRATGAAVALPHTVAIERA